MVRTDVQCHQIMGDTVGSNLIGSGFELHCHSLFCCRSWEETSGFTAGCDRFYPLTTSSPLPLDQGESTQQQQQQQQQHETIEDNWNDHEPKQKIIWAFICQACIIRRSDLRNQWCEFHKKIEFIRFFIVVASCFIYLKVILGLIEGHSDGELHKNRDASAQQDVWVWEVKAKTKSMIQFTFMLFNVQFINGYSPLWLFFLQSAWTWRFPGCCVRGSQAACDISAGRVSVKR